MIALENEHGDLELKIAAGLFDLVADYLGDDNHAAVCFFLERLPVRTVVRLEQLAVAAPDLATTLLRKALECYSTK